jgi:hypothetical protein
MKKTKLYVIIAIISIAVVALAFTFTREPSRVSITKSGTIYDCAGKTIKGVTVSADHVTVRNCVMDGWLGTGITTHGQDNLFENIIINNGECDGSPCDKDGIRFFGSGHDFKNITINLGTCAAPSHCDGVQTYGENAGSDARFDGMKINNMCVYFDSSGNNFKCHGFMIENVAHDIVIMNSVINAYRAVNIGDPRFPAPNNITIVNNTIVGQIPPPAPSVEEWGVFVTEGTNVIVKNNIFYNIVGEHLKGPIDSANNLVYRSDGGRLFDPQFAGDLWNVNPLFMDPVNGDYRLSINSPARGKADDGGDLGAFQFDGS